ncbi:MAG: response regulator, partial [Candidatus Omnitrophica bacterium]|nr:response regulator [Candidatus Omnitrophota bacterium]
MNVQKNQFKILIIEDDSNVYNTLKRGFDGSEYQVWRATSGTEALKLFKNINFMVVISEAMMPDITGTEL